MAWNAGINDVEFFFVWRETNAIRPIHIISNDGRLPGLRVKPVNVSGQFEGSFMALIIRHDAVAGIGKPDCAVRMHREIVRRVELLAAKTIHKHGDCTIVFGSGYSARVMLAGD